MGDEGIRKIMGCRSPFLRAVPSHPEKRAFTLVEVLVVISIVTVLVALILATPLGSERRLSEAQLNSLSGALELYRVDNASYPEALDLLGSPGNLDPNPNPQTYLGAGRKMFEALMGTSSYDLPGAGREIYVPGVKRAMVQASPEGDYFIDPWGFPFGYRSLDGSAQSNGGYNPGFFDLWSTGGSTGGSAGELRAWIINWEDPDRRGI